MSNQWFQDQARLGNMYHSHNTTTGLVTVIHATSTGLMLFNPIGSAKDLVVDKATFVGTTLGAIGQIGIAVSPTKLTANATGTAAVVHNAKVSGSDANKGVATVLSICTLGTTPVWLRSIGASRITGSQDGNGAFEADFNGTLVVPPGMYIGFAALTTTRAGLMSFSWAEVDAT